MVGYILYFLQKFYYFVKKCCFAGSKNSLHLSFTRQAKYTSHLNDTLFPSFVSLVSMVQSAVIKTNLSYAGFSYPSVCTLFDYTTNTARFIRKTLARSTGLFLGSTGCTTVIIPQ